MTRTVPMSAAAAMASSLMGAPANALSPLPGATASASATTCTTDPCQYGYYQSAPAAGTPSTFPLAQFGVDYPVYSSPSQTTTTKTTPGVISPGTYGSDNVSSVAIDGSPRVTVAAANTAYVGSTEISGTLAYSFRVVNFSTPWLLGEVRLAKGDAAGAATAFRLILANPGVSIDPLHPMARLGLARAERLAGDIAASRRDYAALLDVWREADADLPLLVRARVEAGAVKREQ